MNLQKNKWLEPHHVYERRAKSGSMEFTRNKKKSSLKRVESPFGVSENDLNICGNEEAIRDFFLPSFESFQRGRKSCLKISNKHYPMREEICMKISPFRTLKFPLGSLISLRFFLRSMIYSLLVVYVFHTKMLLMSLSGVLTPTERRKNKKNFYG